MYVLVMHSTAYLQITICFIGKKMPGLMLVVLIILKQH